MPPAVRKITGRPQRGVQLSEENNTQPLPATKRTATTSGKPVVLVEKKSVGLRPTKPLPSSSSVSGAGVFPKRRVALTDTTNASKKSTAKASTTTSRIVSKSQSTQETASTSKRRYGTRSSTHGHVEPIPEEIRMEEVEEDEERQIKKQRTSEADYEEQQQQQTIAKTRREPLHPPRHAARSRHEQPSLSNLAAREHPDEVGWEDLDADDGADPLMVAEYVNEVYEYLRELEKKSLPRSDYMSDQKELSWKMRSILVDWLIEIHTKFRLLPETIFLAINILDRFLSIRGVSLVKFQLVGITALFIASKYEEVTCPSVGNFHYMTDGGYTEEEILNAERYILTQLSFDMSYPNPINFLRRISKADDYDTTCRTMAKYLMEISIVDYRFIGVCPSLIAAASVWLARKILNRGSWSPNLVHYSGYPESEIKPLAQLILDYLVRNSNLATSQRTLDNPFDLSASHGASEGQAFEFEHPALIKKYSARKFYKASVFIATWVENTFKQETKNPVTQAWETTLLNTTL